jgi:predicted DCC family thiol-disulfide oxidoreductase YuxK
VYHYVLHFPVRDLLWGPNGLWPYEHFLRAQPFLSVWQISGSEAFFQAVYLGGLAVAVAFTLGWWSRVVGPLHWLMVWSLQERNPFITDGGDNIMRLVLLFLAFVNTGAHLSIDSLRVRQPLHPAWRYCAAAAHNAGVVLILAQLAFLYMSTGLYKVMGELWQNGTALYYILRVDEFSWPGVAEFIYRNPYLVVLGTYGTVLFEVTFLPALLSRWTRYAAALAGVFFHLSIALIMGLVTFGWSMLSLYPLLITDAEYRSLGLWFRRRAHLVVLYDGWCSLCVRSVGIWSAVSPLALVAYVSFRDPGVLELYGVDPEAASRRMIAVAPDGVLREGMDAVIAVVARTVTLWPLMPLLVAARLVAGQRLYDAVARRRPVLLPGACEGRCEIPQRPSGHRGDRRR